jgi:LVIVD repeat
VINIRGNNFANLPTSGTYGLAQLGGQWTLSGSSDTTDNFTRTVTIFSNNTVTRSMFVSVNWTDQNGATKSVSAVYRLKDWLSAIKLWTAATQSGNLDLAGTTDGLKVATQGDYAYIVRAAGANGFAIVNISNPAAPTLASTLTIGNNPTNIVVSGNYAYVSSSADTTELQIINISNPAAPVIAGNYNANGVTNALSVGVTGNYAYLLRSVDLLNDEIDVLNIANPAAITKVTGYSNSINMTDISFDGNYAYVGTNSGTQEVLVFNATNPATPTLLATYNLATTGTVNALRATNNRLYIAQGTRLVLYNVTNPAAGALLGSVVSSGTGTVNDLDIEKNRRYVLLATTANAAEFQVVDTVTPATPTVVRVVDRTGVDDLFGISYNQNYNIAIGVGALNTGELQVFQPN